MKIAKITVWMTALALIAASWEINKRVASGIDQLRGDIAAANDRADKNMDFYFKSQVEFDDYKVKAKEELHSALASRKKLMEAVDGLINAEKERDEIYSTAPVERPTWHQLVTFHGNATTRTEYFTINGTDWRIRYSLGKSDSDESHSSMLVYADSAEDDLELIDTNKPAVGTVYGHKPGRYFLDVSSDNFDWEMVIEELK
jgi:hypothetical protein